MVIDPLSIVLTGDSSILTNKYIASSMFHVDKLLFICHLFMCIITSFVSIIDTDRQSLFSSWTCMYMHRSFH